MELPDTGGWLGGWGEEEGMSGKHRQESRQMAKNHNEFCSVCVCMYIYIYIYILLDLCSSYVQEGLAQIEF